MASAQYATPPVWQRLRLSRPMFGSFQWGSPRAVTLVDSGPPAHRLDIAIMGDGYAAADMPLFQADADAIVAAFREIEPMRSYASHFNFYRIDTIAPESGVADLWAPDGPLRQPSPLGVYFSPIAPRRVVGPDRHIMRLATAAGVPWDGVLVVVNTPRRAGATHFTMRVGYASRNSHDFPRIMIHEAGHSIAKLMDEYTDPLFPDFGFMRGRALPNWLLPFANVTLNGRRPKWAPWIDATVACPTDPAAPWCTPETVGAFEGAAYTQFGAYRPRQACLMNKHRDAFCPVCQEQWIKRIYRHSVIADRFTPAADVVTVRVGEPVTFAAELLRPDHIATLWRVRRAGSFHWDEPMAVRGYRDFHTTFRRRGNYRVRCVLEDQDPKIRQPAVRRASRQRHTWRVNVV